MDWVELEFIADVPLEHPLEVQRDRTGWEMVVFELEDEESE